MPGRPWARAGLQSWVHPVWGVRRTRCKAARPKRNRQLRAERNRATTKGGRGRGERWLGTVWGTQCSSPGKDHCPYLFLSQETITLFPCDPCLAFSLGVTIYILSS